MGCIASVLYSVITYWPAFKRWWTRLVPHPVERTSHVPLAILAGVLLYWQWQPMQQFAFWATPSITAGHLLFAVATTGYILIGIYLEECDLARLFGDQYRHYRKQVSLLIPLNNRSIDGGSAQALPLIEPRCQ